MLRSYTRFYTPRSALRHSRSWSLFRDFGRENFTVMPKYGVLLFTLGTASPRQNETKKYKREGSNYEERARDDIYSGGQNFGRETKFHPVRDVIGRIGTEIGIPRTRAARADEPGTRKVVSSGRRLHEASPTGPGSPVSAPLCTGCGVLPEAILHCPGY